jgi:hypothetical protein
MARSVDLLVATEFLLSKILRTSFTKKMLFSRCFAMSSHLTDSPVMGRSHLALLVGRAEQGRRGGSMGSLVLGAEPPTSPCGARPSKGLWGGGKASQVLSAPMARQGACRKVVSPNGRSTFPVRKKHSNSNSATIKVLRNRSARCRGK